jgi:hypothetical protein
MVRSRMCAEWWSHKSDDYRTLLGNSRVLLLLEGGNVPETTLTNWDEHCCKCIRKNGFDPEEFEYCPAEDDCEYMKEKRQHDKDREP